MGFVFYAAKLGGVPMNSVVSRPFLGTGRYRGVFAIVAMLASAAKAATYTATDLYTLQIPAGTSPTSPDGLHPAIGGQVVGAEEYSSPSLGGDTTDALLWTGPAGTAIDLNPAGYVTSEAEGIGGNQQVGSAAIEVSPNVYQRHGLLWTGSAASAVDLNPVGFTQSQAYGSDGVNQVGWGTAQLPFVDVAVLWSGTAASGVELEPPTGFYISEAFSVSGNQQVGFGYSLATNNPMHALLWSGTSASVVDLNPKGFNNSQALGVGGGLQVGYAENVVGTNGPPPPTFAMLWSGTAASAINLNPAGFTSSEAEDVGDGMEVGAGHNASTNENDALLWSGSAASVVDLASLLPAGEFTESFADSIDASGNIFGIAVDQNGSDHAIEWSTQPIPEPASVALFGIGLSGLLAGRSFRGTQRAGESG
jgi:PEP-CTERM motif